MVKCHIFIENHPVTFIKIPPCDENFAGFNPVCLFVTFVDFFPTLFRSIFYIFWDGDNFP